MYLSKFFLPTIKENPSEASIISHRLMLKSGMIRQLGSGIYSWLPMGLLALRNVENIVKNELNKIGCLEILMPCIQPAELWQESGRYDDYGKEMLKIVDRHEHNMLFGPTHEEVITDIFRKNITSYKDLPKNLYQIQWKFRDEIRPRFGVMRAREFYMKDGYSFDVDFESSKKTYELMYITYLNIFKSLGIYAIPVKADNGAIGGELSHEFHIVANTGESEIFYDIEFERISKESSINIDLIKNLYAAANEKHDPNNCNISSDKLQKRRGIEVGHIFHFGTKYSKSMNAMIKNKDGNLIYPEMGSYGIGISRLVAAIIEASHDNDGIIWPDSISPFKISLINLKPENKDCDKMSNKLYDIFREKNVTVLYDDTSSSPGSKFSTHDLLGMSWQVIVGPRSIQDNLIELKNRRTGERAELSIDSVMAKLDLN